MTTTTRLDSLTEPCMKLQPLISYLDSLTGQGDLKVLDNLLSDLDITRDDLATACQFGHHAYQRNIVKETEWYELVVLCWRSGQVTPIHDHFGSSCAFRVIEGLATETRFNRTASGLISPESTAALEPGYVCAADEADIHQVSNQQAAGNDLVTLHIYSPPLRQFNKYSLESPVVQRTTFHPASSFEGGLGI